MSYYIYRNFYQNPKGSRTLPRNVRDGSLVNVNAMAEDPENTKRIIWPDDWKALSREDKNRLRETEQIPPLAPSFWDPDDRATWIITLGKRQENFNKILLICINTEDIPLLIYKRGGKEDKHITTISGRPLPLPLKGPDYLPCGAWFVTIILNDSSYAPWMFQFDDHYDFDFNIPLSPVFQDAFDESVAQVSYEIITVAARAHLQFYFIPLLPLPLPQQGELEEEEERTIQILEGTIFATHNGNGETKRIVKQLSSLQKPLVVVVPTKNNNVNKVLLPVDRYVFGVPMGSKFQVTVEKLICCTTNLGDERGEQGPCFQISGDLNLDVPTHCRSEEHFFKSTGRVELGLTVSWSSP